MTKFTRKTKKLSPLSAIAILSALLTLYFSGCGNGNNGNSSVASPDYYAVYVRSPSADTFGDGAYAAGATVVISAGEAPDGQRFKNWTTASDGVTFSDENRATTTFIMPANNVIVTANFEPRSGGNGTGDGGDSSNTNIGGGEDGDSSNTVTHAEYLVTVSGDGTGMTGGGKYEAGNTVTVTAGTPQAGYMFKNWTTTSNGVTFTDANRAATTFVMPANAVTVTANFEAASTTNPTYKVTVSGGKGATGGGTYTAGMIVNITAGTDTTGQRFLNWTTMSDGVTFVNANSSVTSFNMPANNVTVTANFDNAATYAVTVSGGTGATGSGRYVSGKVVSITAGTAPTGQRFKNWTTSSSGVTFANASNASTSFTMPSNAVTVTAVFESIYTVTISSAGTGATGGGTYAVGATVSINAGTAPAGQRFKNWTTSSNGVTFANANSASTSFPMPSNAVTVTAVFETILTITYSVNVSSIGYGATGTGYYASGTTVSISAGTARDYVFVNWTSSSSGVSFANANSATTTFTMPENAVTVTANFKSGFIDARDGKFYRIVTIGGKKWMAENLNYLPPLGNSWCYANDADYCADYGRLYDWDIAKLVCPSGWHLPSRQEWGALAIAAGGTGEYGGDGGTAGIALRSTSGWIRNGTDTYGFSALPGGYAHSNENGLDFISVDVDGYWWTSTEWEGTDCCAYTRSIYYNNDKLQEHGRLKGSDSVSGQSVRCIAD